MPSASKLMISSKLQECDKMPELSNTNSYRSLTPLKPFPLVQISSTKLPTSISRSKSPLILREKTLTKQASQDNSFSYVKLPRINSGVYNLRQLLKTRVK